MPKERISVGPAREDPPAPVTLSDWSCTPTILIMKNVVIRPRIQVPFLVVIFAVWTLIGVIYFTNGHVVAERNWFGIELGFICVIMGLTGIWRTLRLGIVIDDTGVRMRHLDSRDHFISWSDVQSVECAQIDERAGLPLYGPVIQLSDDSGALPIRSLGSYSRQDAERKVKTMRDLVGGPNN